MAAKCYEVAAQGVVALEVWPRKGHETSQLSLALGEEALCCNINR